MPGDYDLLTVNFHLIFAIVAGSLGSAFQHGYNTGVLNEIQNVTMEWIRGCRPGSQECEYSMVETTYIWAWIVSIFCLGGFAGALCVGVVASGMGRKNALLANNVFVFLGGAMMGSAKYVGSYAMLIGGRFMIGIASGLAAGLTPMYLSEISPSSVRGAVGTVYQLIITMSILLSQVLGVQYMLGSSKLWPCLLGLTVVPSVFQLLTLPWCPESPSYLFMDKRDRHRAVSALIWLRGTKDVTADIDALQKESDEQVGDKVGFKSLFRVPSLRKPLLISVMMMLAQQMTGINAIIFYSTDVFVNAGISHEMAQMATIGLGLANVVMTVFAIFIIEKAGRKTLLLLGLAGMLVSTAGLFVCLLISRKSDDEPQDVQQHGSMLSVFSVISLIAYIVFFALGPGPIPWFFVSELFNQSARPAATSVAVGVNWMANFIVSLAFQPIATVIGPYVFVIFLVTMVLFIIYIWYSVPETKDKTIAEITAQFR